MDEQDKIVEESKETITKKNLALLTIMGAPPTSDINKFSLGNIVYK